MSNDKRPRLLPQEILQAQMSQIDLLMAMYPDEQELAIDSATSKYLDLLRDYTDSGMDEVDNGDLANVPNFLVLELHISVEVEDATSPDKVQLSVEIPVRSSRDRHEDTEDGPPDINVRLRQPQWLNRSQTSQINNSIPTDLSDDIVGTIEHITQSASSSRTAFTSTDSVTSTTSQQARLVRVWFYFPSLSTRAKRDDLVSYAASYSLTGFVLAGKPGLLVVEGEDRKVDEYMRTIKTESWGDIPSHHKKVSERYRQVIGGEGGGKVFDGMREITDAEWLGVKRGERGNRSDMGMVEGWLVEKGLGGALEKVLM